MAKVYVVTSGSYSEYRIEGVFSTRAAAERLTAEMGAEANEVEEYELDGRAGETSQVCFHCYLDDEGRIGGERQIRELVPPRHTEVIWRMGRPYQVVSAVSAEHAVKLAAEAWQAWLRNRAVGVSPDAGPPPG